MAFQRKYPFFITHHIVVTLGKQFLLIYQLFMVYGLLLLSTLWIEILFSIFILLD